jgi:hypothetical protein
MDPRLHRDTTRVRATGMLWNRARMAMQPFPRLPVLAVSGSFRLGIASSSTRTSRRNDWRIAFSAFFLAYA